jgi:hypothetical protein
MSLEFGTESHQLKTGTGQDEPHIVETRIINSDTNNLVKSIRPPAQDWPLHTGSSHPIVAWPAPDGF